MVVLEGALFRADGIKRAAYKLSAALACDIRVTPNGFSCTLTPLHPASADEMARLVSEFKIEVLDQDLRLAIAEETAPLRTAILGYAFSRTGLQGE
ncbi:MAG: hypothetical protein WEF50_00470 [Myxococcota bacterium]